LSRIFSVEEMGAAQSVALGALGQARAGTFQARFADGQEILRPRAASLRQDGPLKIDPVEQVRAEAFAQGLDEGMRLAAESVVADQDAKMRLVHALEQIAPAANGALSSLLSAAVIRLVTQIVGEAPVNPDVLSRRVEAVSRFIEDGQSRNSLHLHPDDIAMLSGYDFGFPLIPDGSLSRGSVRLDTADGWIEDGPDVQLSRLRAMLDDMEGQE